MRWLDRLLNWLRPAPAARRTEKAAPVIVRAPVAAEGPTGAGSAELPHFAPTGSVAPSALRTGFGNGAERRDRLSRAFTPAQPVSDLNRFSGREELVGRLIRAIENQKMHVVLYGDRGMGKTSMLHALAILAKDARYLVRYTSCSETSDFDTTFTDVSKDIPLLYYADLDPAEVTRDKSFADLLDERPVSVNHLCELYGKIRGARILVIIDEFDRATSPGFRNAIAEMIKNLSDRGAPVQLVIGGVAGNLNQLITFIPSIRRNLIGIPVTGMTAAELEQIVERGETISGLRYGADVRGSLVELAAGSPYLLNLLAYEAGSRTIDRGEDVVTVDDLTAAARGIADDMRTRLDIRPERQLDALESAMSTDQLRTIAREAIGNFGRLSPGSVTALRTAAGSSVNEDDDGEFRFADDAMPLILWLGARPHG